MSLYGAPTHVYLAVGTNYPDALAGGVIAGIGPSGRWQPLLLTQASGLGSPGTPPPGTGNALTFITASKGPLRTGHLLGGTGVMPDAIGTAFVNAAK